MLKLENIHVHRGRTHVLKGVDLEVAKGEVVALIGANGAGKTTTLRTISGLFRPQQGRVTLQSGPAGKDQDITGLPAERIVALGVSHCPEGRQVFSQLTVRENLLVGAYLRKDKEGIREDMERVESLFPILAARFRQSAGSLSGGEQMMLALGRAIMSRPRLLLLDEPSLGLAPLVVEQIFAMLAEINKEGATLLLVEQNASMALELASRAYVIETGRTVLSGPSSELARAPQVKAAYLGGAA
jgi:branched-chain amino acid transport system ATP-binding protein